MRAAVRIMTLSSACHPGEVLFPDRRVRIARKKNLLAVRGESAEADTKNQDQKYGPLRNQTWPVQLERTTNHRHSCGDGVLYAIVRLDNARVPDAGFRLHGCDSGRRDQWAGGYHGDTTIVERHAAGVGKLCDSR